MNAACKQLEKEKGTGLAEIIVVDNNSGDDSVQYLEGKFEGVKFYRNNENLGFGRANNRALQTAKGEFVLFLNPDTILPEKIFTDCVSFFQSNPSTGAVGVRMIDGQGMFLPESKRGFPTAWRSLAKLSGLSSLFPSSKSFAGYNLGHLDQRGIFKVDALAGAFLMARRNILNNLGGFDEQFFMYAEDIDLSKRMRDAGYENYYLGNLTILHFKGESTKRDRKYVELFYKAMNQYVEKHYKSAGSKLTVSLMNMGIRMRRSIAKANTKPSDQNARLPATINLVGDKEEIELLKQKLPATLNNASAQVVVLCQGAQFSFADVIKTIEDLPSGKHAIIHSASSASLVGSFRNDQQGISIPLRKT